MNQNLLDAAIKYLELGLSIIPVGKDKKPLIQWKEFQNRRPTVEESKKWFGEDSFATGIAGVTGKISGIIVLDCEAGADLSALKIPKTLTANSGGGGVHYYFKLPNKITISNATRILPLIDIKGEGGYIIMPPSLHSSGNYYSWADNFGIDDVEPATAPRWLLNLIEENKQKKSEGTDKNWPEVFGGVDTGKRNETAASVVGKLLLSSPTNEWETVVWPAIKGWNLQNKPALSESELRSVFESIAKREAGKGDSESESENEDKSKAKQIINLAEAENIKLFYDQFSEPYAAMQRNGTQILKIKSKQFRDWLLYLAWDKKEMAVASSTIQTVVQTLGAKARFNGQMHELSTRIALYEGSIWYDLGDGHAVRINEKGWDILENPPILFYRFPHQKPQVYPRKGGDIEQILKFFNLSNPDEGLLLQVTLISSFIPGFPHVIITIYGPQGSAKTTVHRLFKSLIDPSHLDTLTPPDSPREFVQTASHHWFIVFDNLSYMSNWLSDALCRACTGGGFSKRELYSDDDDIIYSFRRIIGFNGINLVATRPDLLERSILLGFEQIPKKIKKKEEVFWKEFNEAKPFILGAIFDVIVKALKERDEITLTSSPRMADFAHWGCAIARGMGYKDGDFIKIYNANINQQHEEALEASPIGAAVIELMRTLNVWKGTPVELKEELNAIADRLKLDKESVTWPKGEKANWVWKRLNEIAVNLEAARGIKVSKGKSGDRRIVIKKITDESTDHTVHNAQKSQTNSAPPDIKDSKDNLSAMSNHCDICGKEWRNDPYCPHSFDKDELWELYKRSSPDKIKFSLTEDGCSKTEFRDKDDNFIGEYVENNN